MSKLLLAITCAAGSLLVNLPVCAEISNTTSTFSGQVAATCSINLPEGQTLSLNYDASNNSLKTISVIEVRSNLSPVSISVDRLTTNSEPPPYASSINPYLYTYLNEVVNGRREFIIANKLEGNTLTFERNNISQTIPLELEFTVGTNSMTMGGKYELPSGNYSYTTTYTCLQ